MTLRRTRIPHQIEQAIIALAAEQPKLGRVRASRELNCRGFATTPSTLRTIWRRHGLENAAKRIAAFARASSRDMSAIPHDPGLDLHQESLFPNAVGDYATDLFVFTAMALAVVGSASAETLNHSLDHSPEHDLQSWDRALSHEDIAPVWHDAGVEPGHVFQPETHFDFVL
jgi:hypothetical protein